MSDFFTLRELINENEEQVVLNDANQFFVTTTIDLNKIMAGSSIQLSYDNNMLVSYKSGTFSWNFKIYSNSEPLLFAIFFSKSGIGTGLKMTTNSVTMSPDLGVIVSKISRYYSTTLLPSIQKNITSKGF